MRKTYHLRRHQYVFFLIYKAKRHPPSARCSFLKDFLLKTSYEKKSAHIFPGFIVEAVEVLLAKRYIKINLITPSFSNKYLRRNKFLLKKNIVICSFIWS
jgi:hypothetical protein